jgi:hypothetical protein
MKQKLFEIFESLNPDYQRQLFDYAVMLWEMEQGENQLKNKLGFSNNSSEFNNLPFTDKTDSKNIN